MLAVSFYSAVVALHVMAIVIAFGVTFAYPVLFTFIERQHPRALPAVIEASGRIGRTVITPAAAFALLTGLYLAADHDLFGKVWVNVPLVILIVLMGIGGAFFDPQGRKAAELAAHDVAAAGDGPVELSADYKAQSKKLAVVGVVNNLLVLLAIYFMVAKPFA